MPRPTEIKLHQKSRVLELSFDDGFECNLTCEYLRVSSPSAEVKGHGPGQEVLQVGKEDVGITSLEPSGNYALKIHFDDGHNTGLFTWDYLYELGKNYEDNWQGYLEKLDAAGESRQPVRR
ncbi:MAG: gamma-butyrobetaine hydroxylase-like domain-containing protein [Granulosicoccus sp.]